MSTQPAVTTPSSAPDVWGLEHLRFDRVGRGLNATAAASVVAPWATADGVRCAACWTLNGDQERTDGDGVVRVRRCAACGPGEMLAAMVTATRLPWHWLGVAMGRQPTEPRDVPVVDLDGEAGRSTAWQWLNALKSGAHPGPALVLAGDPGLGKSHIAAMAVGRAWSAGIPARWLSWSGLLADLRASFDVEGVSVLDVWSALLPTSGLLVIDDAGVGRPTDWTEEQGVRLFESVDDDVAVLVTTNGGLLDGGLASAIGDRAARRLMARATSRTMLTFGGGR